VRTCRKRQRGIRGATLNLPSNRCTVRRVFDFFVLRVKIQDMQLLSKKRALDKIYKRRDRYEIPDWQREEVWSTEKKQELIDSILRNWKLPKFYFLRVENEPEEF
jgi:hypothetical protein